MQRKAAPKWEIALIEKAHKVQKERAMKIATYLKASLKPKTRMRRARLERRFNVYTQQWEYMKETEE